MPRPSDNSLSVPGDQGNRHWQQKLLWSLKATRQLPVGQSVDHLGDDEGGQVGP